MATYAIGDLQGCDTEFADLLQKIRFNPAHDRLWLVGDLINRGPASVEVMRRVMEFSDVTNVVLGNHDLHFLAIYFGGHKPNRSDTFDELLNAPDVDHMANWLRAQPLLVRDDDLNAVMVHAGIPHIWTLDQAQARAAEVESVLRGEGYVDFLTGLYGNKPDLWTDALTGQDRVRLITNYLTRIRLTNHSGQLNFSHKGGLVDAPSGWSAWFDFVPQDYSHQIVFGHWAALEGKTSNPRVSALDTGCVWGRQLTARCLETGRLSAVEATN
ncbi:MAG: symmetrical bis(5'-nucleosyl)-tetraphosphatase [Proteobacteria bacterium]|nr:symmetrical bis(5'-nucleosyl)-tetraphosphatase [Pseudomonadota bacterium]